MLVVIINMGVVGGHMTYVSGSQPGDREPAGVHGKISRGTWIADEFHVLLFFNILYYREMRADGKVRVDFAKIVSY